MQKRSLTTALALGLLAVGGQRGAAQMPQDTKTQGRQGDIVEVAVAAGSFKTLATALQAAGLVETLKSGGPFTVFAPTDAAFAKIPESQLKALLADKEKLSAILTYHVVPGTVRAEDVMELTAAKTVNGQSVSIELRQGAVYLGNAKVIKTDIAASNGVIHVIDTVLMPPM